MTDRLDSSNPRTAIEFLWHKNYNVGSLTRLEYRLTVLAESWKQSGVLLPGRVRFAEIRKEQTSPSRASLQENRWLHGGINRGLSLEIWHLLWKSARVQPWWFGEPGHQVRHASSPSRFQAFFETFYESCWRGRYGVLHQNPNGL